MSKFVFHFRSTIMAFRNAHADRIAAAHKAWKSAVKTRNVPFHPQWASTRKSGKREVGDGGE